MNPFDMLGGDLSKMMEQLSGQLGGEDAEGLDLEALAQQFGGAGAESFDPDALAAQFGGQEVSGLDNQIAPEDIQRVRESMEEAGISEDELNAAAEEFNAQMGNVDLSNLTQQLGGADFNNLMIGLTEQMQGGFMGKLMQKMMKKFEKAMPNSEEEAPVQLDQLDDDDLLEALQYRQEREKFDPPADPLDVYTGVKRVFYIVRLFMMEMDEGGLSQYLVNEPAGAAELETMLRTVHADEIADLLHRFLEENGIAPDSLSAESVEAYMKLERQYDFDSFDDAYYRAEPPIGESLAAYCRAHLEEF